MTDDRSDLWALPSGLWNPPSGIWNRPMLMDPALGRTREETSLAMLDAFTFDALVSYLIIGAVLMTLGMLGFLTRRNLIVMFLSVEMMLQGTALSLVGFGRYHGNWTGQVFT